MSDTREVVFADKRVPDLPFVTTVTHASPSVREVRTIDTLFSVPTQSPDVLVLSDPGEVDPPVVEVSMTVRSFDAPSRLPSSIELQELDPFLLAQSDAIVDLAEVERSDILPMEVGATRMISMVVEPFIIDCGAADVIHARSLFNLESDALIEGPKVHPLDLDTIVESVVADVIPDEGCADARAF